MTSRRMGKSWTLHYLLLCMGKGETMAYYGPDGVRVFRLEDITTSDIELEQEVIYDEFEWDSLNEVKSPTREELDD
jgi:hypothetical protein